MFITIRKTGGPVGTDEVLGRFDDTHLDARTRHQIALQLETLVDLASSHEPCAAEGVRYELEIQGPGHTSNFLVVEDAGDPGHPTVQALAAILRTLGLAPAVAGAGS